MLVQVVFGVAIIDKSCTVHPNMKVNMNKMVKSTTKENRGMRHVASRAPGGPPAAPATTATPAAPAPAPAVVAVVAAAAAPAAESCGGCGSCYCGCSCGGWSAC